jgi:hypothetical protein
MRSDEARALPALGLIRGRAAQAAAAGWKGWGLVGVGHRDC